MCGVRIRRCLLAGRRDPRLANTLAVAVEAQRRQDARDQLLREKVTLLRDNEALLREKDLLMQEVHHRVMNLFKGNSLACAFTWMGLPTLLGRLVLVL